MEDTRGYALNVLFAGTERRLRAQGCEAIRPEVWALLGCCTQGLVTGFLLDLGIGPHSNERIMQTLRVFDELAVHTGRPPSYAHGRTAGHSSACLRNLIIQASLNGQLRVLLGRIVDSDRLAVSVMSDFEREAAAR